MVLPLASPWRVRAKAGQGWGDVAHVGRSVLLSTQKKPRLSTLSYCRQDYVCRGFNEDKTKLGSLPPVLHPLSFFIVSPPILHPLSIFVFSPWLATIFYCVTNLFSCVIKNHVSFASHNHNPYTRSYRGTLRMYLWYFKKKGVNVGNICVGIRFVSP